MPFRQQESVVPGMREETRSAKDAGYSEKSAASIGAENLRKP